MTSERRTTYLDGGEGRTALAVHGAGARAVVVVPGLLSHIDVLWERPSYRAWSRGLLDLGRVVAYDRLGTGASDPVDRPTTVADRVDELHRVIDWCGDDVVLLGWFDGAGIAVRAAGHGAVRAVVLHSAYRRPPAPSPDIEVWGTGVVAARLLGEGPSDGDGGRLERATAPPSAARGLLASLADGAVAGRRLDADVLVVHPTRGLVPPELAPVEVDVGDQHRFLSIALDTAAVAPWGDAAADGVRAVLGFATGTIRSRSTEVERVLRAVMVTDIERSTERAAAAGDREWRHLLETHDAVTRARIDANGGHFGRHTGDGIIATFASTIAAVRCACEVSAEAQRIGLPVRIGLHVGDLELRGEVPNGTTVRIADALASMAVVNQVVVSATLREALAGTVVPGQPGAPYEHPGGARLGTYLLTGEPPPG